MLKLNVSAAAVAFVGAALLRVASPSLSAQSSVITVEAGPIWNQMDAEKKCPQVARANGGTWNGQWRTTIPGTMSVCEVRLRGSRHVVEAIEAGPIWNQMDAEKKCPEIARANRGVWNGHWRTTVPGRMSVCMIRLR